MLLFVVLKVEKTVLHVLVLEPIPTCVHCRFTRGSRGSLLKSTQQCFCFDFKSQNKSLGDASVGERKVVLER